MWIVRLALRRPYTFVVAALLVAIVGILAIVTMPTDIFPDIKIPVISVAFSYTGMPPEDLEQRIISNFERSLTTTVNDIEHLESQSLTGIGIIKVYFQKNVNIEKATAQVTAIAQTAIRNMPPGTQPPLILQYSASDVPIIQLLLTSDTLSEQDVFDKAVNVLRPQLVTLSGVQIPYPYGGRQRQIVVDLAPEKMQAYGVSPADVSGALNAQNLILPAGSTKIGMQEYQVRLNSSPKVVSELNQMPIKTVNGTTVYISDIANVRDGFQVQTNVVHSNGRRGILLSILKSGGASTLDVVDRVNKALPHIRTTMPPEIAITPLFDQSVFVRASVEGVVKEAAIAAGLTALMILLFLGSWRSTIIVMISIPLSILVSIIVLYMLGETLNVMTLGGMALAVGILVDDATVAIENIHRNLHQRKTLVRAILDGSEQIAVPAFVSTLCICIVFVPVVFISGAAKYLFTPLAMAVVFAMFTSYLISRTLVPTMVHYLLAAEVDMYGGAHDANDPIEVHAAHARHARACGLPVSPEDESTLDRILRWLNYKSVRIVLIMCAALITGFIFAIFKTPLGDHIPAVRGVFEHVWQWLTGHRTLAVQLLLGLLAGGVLAWLLARGGLIGRVHRRFNNAFVIYQRVYGGMLLWALKHRGTVVAGFVMMVVVTAPMVLWVGQDFFPSVDVGQLRLHVRCPPGTRIEQSEDYFAQVQDAIREIIPDRDIGTVLDNIGIPNSSINLSLSDGSLMSAADGEILVSLNEGHKPTEFYMRELRAKLPEKFPHLKFYFAPADIVTQVLNFGSQAPIDIQVNGPRRNARENEKIAQQIAHDVNRIPGVVDVRMQQVSQTPDIRVNVDRTLASKIGLQQRDVASDLLISLSSSNQTAPNYWLDPSSGVSYNILVQTPQYWMNTINALENTPIVPNNAAASPENTQLLMNLAKTERGASATNITHYNITPTSDVLLSVQGRDLGSTARDIDKIVDQYRAQLPRGSTITLRGQIESMNSSFAGLGFGLIFAVVLVYLLMVMNFQSWVDPLIILMALPGAMCGILWMLWATHTTISVPALMGAIMSIGVATANSILLITFANDQRKTGAQAFDAALAAGLTRLRPVMMTALAMIIGMLPMALGIGEGGEQNAPLGRAVIGGLSVATFATLFFVPVVYSLLRRKAPEAIKDPELIQ